MQQRPVLYMMFGYPGAGKTTAAKVIQEVTGAVRLSSDEVRLKLFPEPAFTPSEHDTLYTTLDEQAETLLKEGKSVIYDANLNRYAHRQDKYDICQRTGAKAMLIWVHTRREVAKDRATHESRQHLWPDDETPDAMFERIASVLERPGPEEPYLTVDGTKITPEYINGLLAKQT